MQNLTTPTILALRSANVLLDIVGQILFGAMIITTVKQKKLHSPCHLFIGIYCLCGFGSKSIIHLPYLLTIFQSTFPLYLCACFQLLPVCLQYGAFPMMLAVGLDRLMSVLFPIWYQTRSNKFYVFAILAIVSVYPFSIAGSIISDVVVWPMNQTACNNLTLFPVKTILYVFILPTLICYVLLVLIILWKYKAKNFSSIRQSLFKSLGLIILVQIGGWIIVTNSGIIFSIKGLTSEQMAIIMYCLTNFSSMFTSAEVPILYFTSSDHRHSLRKQFISILRFLPKFSSSINTNAVVVPHSNPPIFVTPAAVAKGNNDQRRNTLARISIQGPRGSVGRYS